MTMTFAMTHPSFKFRPLSFSWVALHPQPKGVIRFIGGAFFGTFPTLFYRFLLSALYQEGYTIIAIPFRFSFQHWAIAGGLFAEQQQLPTLLVAEAEHLGYETAPYTEDRNYSWVGHSLGCKYIALLEFLSDPQQNELLRSTIGQAATRKVTESLAQVNVTGDISIQDQSSLLIAPDISDTESAIPIRFLAHLLDKLGLGVMPTRPQTQALIRHSHLFNLAALIAFDQDHIAGSLCQPYLGRHPDVENDVYWFKTQLSQKLLPLLAKALPGRHLEPLGFKFDQITFNPFGDRKFDLRQRLIEPTVSEMIRQLHIRATGTFAIAPIAGQTQLGADASPENGMADRSKLLNVP